ncbi:ATP-binding cassette domain-containing protein [Halarcobacter anaerophilus]|uniref:ATP-binding cassette domain-containing protein n=1 Tax=Halarcobacter anaerophilus TaxID=877500 RepID=UPI0018E3172C|nr:ATP-binding cassette domain-containing protein [Halarcobacter anaerophilus]
MMVLKIKDLSKIFGTSCPDCLKLTGAQTNSSICPKCNAVVGVNNVNLELEKGEVLGIVGESGSGKSTLLQLIYQDQKATFGEVFVENYVDKDGKPKNIIEANLNDMNYLRNILMSMIYQNPRLGLNYRFSAGGNIAQKVIGSGTKSYEKIRQKAEYFLDKTEIPVSRIDDYPDRFSGGQQQRIQISKALSSNPKLLLWMSQQLDLISQYKQRY